MVSLRPFSGSLLRGQRFLFAGLFLRSPGGLRDDRANSRKGYTASDEPGQDDPGVHSPSLRGCPCRPKVSEGSSAGS